MEATLIWVGGLVVEALLIATAVLAVLLRRSHKARQQLTAQLADLQTSPAETGVVSTEAPELLPEASSEVPPEVPAVEIPVLLDPAPVEARPIEIADTDDEPARASDAAIRSEFDELREIIDNARLDESTDRLQQRLNATQESLQRLAIDIERESTEPGERHLDIAPLQHNLQEMTSEIDSLQQNNAQLQQDLRNKAQDMEKSIAEKQENTDRVLHHAKKLRKDMTMLREKLKNRESDVQQLQTANEALAAEYAALNKEYERIYTNSTK